MKRISKVIWDKRVNKQLAKLSRHIASKVLGWVNYVEVWGLRKSRLLSAYHEEPLHGDRYGQRSIRLNRAYIAIYKERFERIIELIEVNKHDY